MGKLPALNELIFNTVGFQAIPIAAFRELRSLKKLDIRDSQITTIYAESFADQNLRYLTELVLRQNKIDTIHSDAFEYVCENLEVLDLALNALNQTCLKAFESKNWTNLIQLNLSYNKRIGSITSSVFRNMPRLEYLNLVEINLHVLSAEMFMGLPSLHTADLSYNQIEGIKNAAFRGSPKLRELRLGYQFNDIPDLAKELDLYPAIFDGVRTSLEELSLEETKVQADHFWTMIRALPSLQTLRASKTGLNTIPDNAFFHNTKLQLVDLSQNGITELSNSAFLGIENSLIKVILQSNNISSISHCVFKDFTKLYNLMLYGNKLHCDCKLSWLRDFIIKKSENDDTFQKYTYSCSSPPEYKDMFLFNISALACHGLPGEVCNYVTIAPTVVTTISKSVLTGTPTTATHTSTKAPVSVLLNVGGTTQTSMTLFWTFYGNKKAIAGFKLDYSSVIDNVKHSIPIHPDMNGYEISSLKPGVFYKICVTVEYLSYKMPVTTDCKTRQTQSQVQPTYPSFQEDSSTNTLAIIVVTAVIVVILVIAGLYMLVKYKIQKLRELRLTMASPGLGRFDPYGCQEESSSCTVPNEYTEMRAAKLAQKHKIYSTKQLQRQLATDNTYHERGYSTYHKIKDKRRPRQTDATDPCAQEDEVCTAVDEQSKPEVSQRHSAPSRLDASDLMKTDRAAISRPLPATPTDHTGPEKRDSKELKEQGKANVFVTQASIYEHKVKETLETVEEDQKEKIYHEINEEENVSR